MCAARRMPTVSLELLPRESWGSIVAALLTSLSLVPPLPPTNFKTAGNSLSDKYDRMPPSLDMKAASMSQPTLTHALSPCSSFALTTNKDGGIFRQGGQLTPVSASSGSRSLSPKTPDSRAVGGRGNDYFEPSIASDNDSGYSQGRRPGGYGGLSRRDEYDDLPLSPNNQQPSFFSKLNNMASGPFDVGGGRGRTGPPRNNNAFPPRDNLDSGFGSDRRPSTAASNRSMTGKDNGSSQRIQRKDGYGGLGKPDRFEPEPFKRAGTFPKPNEPTGTPARTPSAPGNRRDRNRVQSRDTLYEMIPDTSRPPPPRKSLIRPVVPGNEGIDLAAEFGSGNPYHTPSASMSSAISSYSQHSIPSDPSSKSSPPASDGRKPSGASSIDDLMNDLQSSMEEMQPPTPRLDRNPSMGSSRRGRSRDGRSTSRGRSGSRSRQQGSSRPEEPNFNLKAELDRYNSSRDRNGAGYGQPFKPQDKNMFGEDMYGRSMDSQTSGPRPFGSDRERQGSASGASRGPCKACGEEIRGKCISSADGRLTGKYHKACFVCTTCRSPFSSAEFYVLGDRPYCELHYHRLNGSLCGGCGRGIEGQYLEDEALVKYHVGCFRCADCGMSLSNGYFEVDGGTYCERDAWRRAQQPAAGSSPDGALPSPVASDYSPALAGVMSPMTPGFNRFAPGMPAPPRGRGMPMGLPQRPGNAAPVGAAGTRRPPPPGLPRGQKLPPGAGPAPRARMNKRNTRLGIM